jgi:hypothetical protein
MEAMAWTAIGLLGAAVLGSFGSSFYLGTRIDALGARLDSRIDAQSERIDAQSDRIDAQSDRIDAQGARIDAQHASIQGQGRDLMSAIQAQGRDLAAAIHTQGTRPGRCRPGPGPGTRLSYRRPRGQDGRPSWASRELTAPAR